MDVAVIGSGGREHAIIWKLARDSRVKRLYALPGNGGTAPLAVPVPVLADRVDDIHRVVLDLRPDLVVVGPETPLAMGIADRLQSDNILCFGPTAAAARIETSKVFAKQLMARERVPTAPFRVFDAFNDLRDYVLSQPLAEGWVVKADGLAAGKGAFVCSSMDETIRAGYELLEASTLGEAGRRVVLERKLSGREASVLFWCDGERFAALPAAQDYKRAFSGDAGPNTGGMGSFCPVSHLTEALRVRLENEIVRPMVAAMAEDGAPFRGILYVGLMLTEAGPYVIEFNCRFGDPETQAILPAWSGNLLDMLVSCASGNLDLTSVTTAGKAAVCIVLAAQGYPGTYRKDLRLVTIPDTDTSITFHAGTAVIGGRLVNTGGRVLNAVAVGDSVESSRSSAYELAQKLTVPGLYYRTDIASG